MEIKRIYWDTCAFIHLIQQKPEYYDALADMIEKARNGECEIVTSSVTIAETCKLPELGLLPIEQSRKIFACFENPYIMIWDTAVISKSIALITTDTKKNRRRGLLAHDGKLGEPPLSIKTPSLPEIGPLFNPTQNTNE